MSRLVSGQIVPVFPKTIGEYQIEISQYDNDLIEYYLDRNNAERLSHTSDGYKGPLQSFDDFFQILYLQQNLLVNDPNFANLKNLLLGIVDNYLTEALGFVLPEDCILDIADSWFIKLSGGNKYPNEFQHHNHAFALLSGILYLDDSENGLYFLDQTFGKMYWPFVWHTQPTPYNQEKIYIQPKRGKVVLFCGNMDHALVTSDNDRDVRRSLVFNIWPKGVVSEQNAGSLRM